MLIHPAITGGEHPEFDEAHRYLINRISGGLGIGDEILPVAEGTDRFADQAMAQTGHHRWCTVLGRKLARRPDLDPPAVVMPDYEPGEGAEQFRFLTLAQSIDPLTLAYMAGISAATQAADLGGTGVPPVSSPSIGFFALPALHGASGYTPDQLAELRRLVELTRVTHVFPSMRPRRSIGAGITAAAQKRRVQIASEQLLNLFADTDAQVWPEVCPLIFGGGAIAAATHDDGAAMMEGFAAAGITDLVLWLQGETLAVARFWFSEPTRVFTAGLAAAAPTPRPRETGSAFPDSRLAAPDLAPIQEVG
ncbi:MAG: hypothetical protein KJZ65_06515 [Phycisphaerales bacterium]|nr:hypothetical protein [Phycisphaerales bacterium]